MINSTAINICDETISVDKIVPELGYVKGNIVFCCNKINIVKNNCSIENIKEWMPEWYDRIQKYLNNHLKV